MLFYAEGKWDKFVYNRSVVDISGGYWLLYMNMKMNVHLCCYGRAYNVFVLYDYVQCCEDTAGVELRYMNRFIIVIIFVGFCCWMGSHGVSK